MIRRAFLVAPVLLLAMGPRATPGDRIVGNDRIALGFSEGGGPSMIEDRLAHRGLAAEKSAALFRLEFAVGGATNAEKLTLGGGDARGVAWSQSGSDGATTGRLVFADVGGRGVAVTCTVAAARGDPFLRCAIGAGFPEPLILESASFPMVTLKPSTSPDEAALLGTAKGGVFRRPSAEPRGRTVSGTMPGNLAAQFGCWYDGTSGFFTGVLDDRGCRKTLSLSRTADGLAWTWSHGARATGAWSPGYEVALSVFRGSEAGAAPDWRDGADLYKGWATNRAWCARTLARRDDLPRWMLEGPAMVRFGREWLAEPDRIAKWLGGYWRDSFPQGTPLIVALWGWEKVGMWVTPDYFPPFPSEEGFAGVVRAARGAGGHVFCWPSGYHWTLTYDVRPDGSFMWDDRSRYEAEGRRHVVTTRTGADSMRQSSWLRGGQNATMCGGDPWTIDWFNRTGDELARRGVEMVQVDQVVGGNLLDCYATGHGHAPGPGVWQPDSFHRQMRSLLATCRAREPGAVVGFEEPSEVFNAAVGIQDYRDTESPGEWASVFAYLYHEYLPLFQSNPRADSLRQAAWCAVRGQIPHMVPSRREAGPALDGGGFETWADGAPKGWERVRGYRGKDYTGVADEDHDRPHGGAASLRLRNTERGQVVQVSRNLAIGGPLKVGAEYEISAWLRGAGMAEVNGIGIGAFDEHMTNRGSWHVQIPESAEWKRGSVRFRAPDGATIVRIMLNLRGRGTVGVDDVRLDEVRPDGTTAEVWDDARPPLHEFMRQWVKLFHGEGRPYLLFGRELHPPSLTCDRVDFAGRQVPAVMHAAWEAPDGTRALVMANATREPRAVTVTWRGRPEALTMAPGELRMLR